MGTFDRQPPAPIRGQLSRPKTGDDLDPVVEQLGPFCVIASLAPKGAELAPEVDSEPHPENDAAAAQMIERDGLARHLPRSAPRKRGNEGGPSRMVEVDTAIALRVTQASTRGIGVEY